MDKHSYNISDTASEPLRERNVEKTSPLLVLFFLLAANAVLRIVFFSINYAEYTDGILQITQFSHPTTLWPPLYTILAHVLGAITGSLESGGKLVSLLASLALVVPVYFLAARMFTYTAAAFAGMLYTVSPIVMRWSVRVMTDSLFAFLFFTAIWLFVLCVDSIYQRKGSLAKMGAAFMLVAVPATLTRYQGLLLFPLALIILLIAIQHKSRGLPILLVSFLLWIAIPLWIAVAGFGHTQQFVQRTAATPITTFFAYFNNFESFIAFLPYFLTYPIAFLFLVGLFSLPYQELPARAFLWLFLYTFFAIIIVQSVFSSFQSRYLLPAILFIIVFAGYGLTVVEKALRPRYSRVFSIVIIIALLYGLLFSCAVMVFQSESFGDIKDSALFVKENIEPGTPVYSNEIYKPEIVCPKMRYWSGRDVQLYTGQPLPDGAVVCVHSAYGGKDAMRHFRRRLLPQNPEKIAQFEATIIPLLPDIMEEPISHQNPLAWIFRYHPQHTTTTIYTVENPG